MPKRCTFVTEQNPMKSSQNRSPPMSSACLLSIEELWSKNKFNQSSEKIHKGKSQARQNNNTLAIKQSQGPLVLPQGP